MKLRTMKIVRRAFVAYTLIEVMIALLIFFMAVFTILGLISNSLRNARILQRKQVDSGMVAAQISLTNRLTEEFVSGDFEDMYPDYEWSTDTYEAATNGLFQVDMIVQRRSGNQPVESKMSILLYRPESPAGSLSRGIPR
jgi:type II secretory pathway pseudopilin PulG